MIKHFYPIWLSQTISIIASELTKFAIPLWLLSTGISTTYFSLVVVITMLPRTIFGLFIGPIVDEGPKKKILIISEIGQAISILGLLLIYKTGFNKYQFLSVLFIHSSFSLFNYPIMSSLVPLILGENDLRKANSLMGITDSVSLLIAPLIGGALVFYKKIEIIFLIDILSFLINIFIIGKTIPTFPGKKFSNMNIISSLKDGLKFFRQESTLSKFLIISTITNFSLSLSFFLAPALLLLIAKDERLVGTVQTLGGGAQLIAIWIIGYKFNPKKLARAEILGTIVFAAVGPLLISLSHHNILTYFGYISALLILPVLNVWNRTLWQTKVPKEMLGRVFATKRFISSLLTPFVTLISGIAVDQLLMNKFKFSILDSYRFLFLFSAFILLLFSFASLNAKWRQNLDAQEL